MNKNISVHGFSKFTKEQKINWLIENYFDNDNDIKKIFTQYNLADHKLQEIHDGFSENTISNYLLPYSLAPNFLINGTYYTVPMVIEESSVVAAASSGAKFWATRGGFHAEVLGITKVGHISFKWNGTLELLNKYLSEVKTNLITHTKDITANMERRGGGLLDMEFVTIDNIENIYQLKAYFNTCDSMGANFINTLLEEYESCLEIFFNERQELITEYGPIEVIMSILSNYTPDCLVRAWVTCPIEDLKITDHAEENISVLADRFYTAIRIAEEDTFRATTHNKGIYNGIDAVILATGNDFRAIEAAGHAYASRSGKYRSLSHCDIKDGIFTFELTVPLAIGTVGGLTSLHPIAKKSMEILGNPDAKTLMMIIACVGLAQNFAAVRSLVTTGIQKGHMKMHLQNILNHLNASDIQKSKAHEYFKDKVISHNEVREFLLNN
jgi:hydroxymethylglutaryl-CoA reductase